MGGNTFRQRHDPLNPKFGRFLNDTVHRFPAGDRLHEGQLVRQRRNKILLQHSQRNAVAIHRAHLAVKFVAFPVQHGYSFVGPKAQHVQSVVRVTL
jgi:hypothetical protein